MNGTVAITDHGWYRFLLVQDDLDEVNFWTPSTRWLQAGGDVDKLSKILGHSSVAVTQAHTRTI